jgi:pimeloyl-ACP methyl ester carboxylesterase
VLWGGANPALSPETADAFVAALKNAPRVEKIVYEGGGHWLNVERPAQSGRDVRRFLDAELGDRAR